MPPKRDPHHLQGLSDALAKRETGTVVTDDLARALDNYHKRVAAGIDPIRKPLKYVCDGHCNFIGLIPCGCDRNRLHAPLSTLKN